MDVEGIGCVVVHKSKHFYTHPRVIKHQFFSIIRHYSKLAPMASLVIYHFLKSIIQFLWKISELFCVSSTEMYAS